MLNMTSVAIIFLALVTASPGAATVPIVAPGECLYLVGAPPGAPLAPTEERSSSTGIEDRCDAISHVGIDESGPNSAQGSIMPRGLGAPDVCRVSSWIGHDFTVASAPMAIDGSVDVVGALAGELFAASPGNLIGGQAMLRLELLEMGGSAPEGTRVANATVFDATQRAGRYLVDRSFAERLVARFRPGATYRVRMILELSLQAQTMGVEFGALGSGNGARYDSIEVCLESPPDDSALRADLAALTALDLERQLYARECLPTIWLPAAQGGRLEEARALAADLLARSIASGDSGVNQHVAENRLQQADASITAGQYQRACRSLSETVRALTTP